MGAAGYVYRPSTEEGVRQVLERASARGASVVLRGAGRSYGDAALAAEQAVLDLSRMRRVLSWDPAEGLLEAEPGLILREIWRYTLGDGWWPAVVSGTMHTSLGGCVAMNVHGKNNWPRGTVGDHVESLDLLTPGGERLTLSRELESDLFHGVIGGCGQLGVVTRIRWRLKAVSSGLLEVKAVAVRNLEEMLRVADESKERYEYVVGWMDAFARGRHLGRGQLHLARHLEPGEDPAPAQSLRLESQDLPDTFFGAIPKSILWRLMKPWVNRPGMRCVNWAKMRASQFGDGAVYRQSLAAFSFLLDYVPGWKKAYLPGGLIQHQSFVPVATAEKVFRQQLEICHRRRQPSFLAVLKRHRADPYLLSHAVDGFSLALDFPVREKRREALWSLVRELAEPVVQGGGRFYPAKDAALPRELYRASFGEGQLDRFAQLRQRVDPQGLLTSALADRLLRPDDPV